MGASSKVLVYLGFGEVESRMRSIRSQIKEMREMALLAISCCPHSSLARARCARRARARGIILLLRLAQLMVLANVMSQMMIRSMKCRNSKSKAYFCYLRLLVSRLVVLKKFQGKEGSVELRAPQSSRTCGQHAHPSAPFASHCIVERFP